MRKIASARTYAIPTYAWSTAVRTPAVRDSSVDICTASGFPLDYDLHRSVQSWHVSLRPTGEMDLTFLGRNNGREFIRNDTVFPQVRDPR